MKNGFILLYEVMHDLVRIKGRILQIEGRVGHAEKAIAMSAVSELAHARTELTAVMDKLVEVQAMFPDPTKSEIVRHYAPPGPGKSEAILTLDELPEEPEAIYQKLLDMGVPGTIEGPPVPSPEVLKAAYNMLEDRRISEMLDDKRPAGWTEALALEFVADRAGKCDELDSFATLFLHGDWATILKEWPEFQTWINNQLEG